MAFNNQRNKLSKTKFYNCHYVICIKYQSGKIKFDRANLFVFSPFTISINKIRCILLLRWYWLVAQWRLCETCEWFVMAKCALLERTIQQFAWIQSFQQRTAKWWLLLFLVFCWFCRKCVCFSAGVIKRNVWSLEGDRWLSWMVIGIFHSITLNRIYLCKFTNNWIFTFSSNIFFEILYTEKYVPFLKYTIYGIVFLWIPQIFNCEQAKVSNRFGWNRFWWVIQPANQFWHFA